MKKWYAIRVTYGRELKFQAALRERGFETFVPMVVKAVNRLAPQTVPQHAPQTVPQAASQTAPQTVPKSAPQAASQTAPQAAPKNAPHSASLPAARFANRDVKKMGVEVVAVPAVSNLCFVSAEQESLKDYFRSLGEACPARFIWDKATRKPIVVPDKAMADFITVSQSNYEDTIYLTELSSKLREGQKVRVIEGPFAGVEGRIVRIRRSRRILVELPGMLSVAATFVPTDNLEPIL